MLDLFKRATSPRLIIQRSNPFVDSINLREKCYDSLLGCLGEAGQRWGRGEVRRGVGKII